MKKKIFVVIIMICLLLFSNVATTLADEKSELQSQSKNVQSKIESTQSEISEVKAQVSDTMKQIQNLDSEISNYESQIDDLDSKIGDLENSIKEEQIKLDEAEKKYNDQEKMLQQRLVSMYEAGDTSYLDVLLSSADITDFISNYYIISEIAEYDTELLDQMNKNKNTIKTAKESLETNKSQIEAAKSSKQAKASSLKASQTTKQNYVNQLSEDEKSLQADLEKLQSEQNSITRQLKNLQNTYSSQIANLKGSGVLQKPVTSGVITATMYYSSGKYHGALDYGIPVGTNVYAAEEGVVLVAGWSGGGYGYYVCLQHANGLRTYYGHGNGTFYVSQGQTVSKGQLIMLSGNSGNSTGPHLHFEVRVSPYNWSYGGNDSRRDPRNYL